MISKKSDDAISPVIGVMLMLVVTVVIAAAVTIFATGVVGETEVAPVAVLDVEILSSVEALEGMKGPELFITHLSGEAVDTKDIELRFSWNCGVDNCQSGGTHYSTYSADGCKGAHPNGIDNTNTNSENVRKQALYVKSSMLVQKENPEYGSENGRIDHYFGDVILTPGMKLTANSEFLDDATNTESKFMNVIFDNYNYEMSTEPMAEAYYSSHAAGYDSNCKYCIEYSGECTIGSCVESLIYGLTINEGDCATCTYNEFVWNGFADTHPTSWCSTANGCLCAIYSTKTVGIMKHLQPGTAVDVMIVHTPSGKAIYDNTVIVQ